MRRLAGAVEAERVGAAADPVDRLLAYPDPGGRFADDSGVGERLDILPLLFRSEAVVAVPQRHGLEIEQVPRAAGGRVEGRGDVVGRRLGRVRQARIGSVHPYYRT
jgi:hypothetical protein